jgi:hypothetical protein
LSITTTKDGKVIRSDCVKLFMDSNDNVLKGRVGRTMSEDSLLTYYLVGEFG